jgi:dihydropteroate synthase
MMQTANSLRLGSRLLDISVPRIMGIINITPDSFFSGSRAQDVSDVLRKAGQMIEDGADILDIGGQSTRPGATILSAEEEWARLETVLPELRKAFPHTGISVDTFYADVARRASDAGVDIINDVSGGEIDTHMFRVVADMKLPYILMHSRGNSQTMNTLAQYDDVVEEVISYFHRKVYELRKLGVSDIILDPGIGFAKKPEHGFTLLAELQALRVFGLPLLIGISRKSLVHKTLNTGPEESLYGTTALHMWCISHGVRILRVHDVKPAADAVAMYMAMQQ